MKRLALLVCVASGLLFPCAPRAGAQKAFKPDRLCVVDSTGALLEFDDAGAFVTELDDDSAALAFGPDGLLWVASATGIRALDADGDVEKSFGAGDIVGTPVGLAFGADGELFVAVQGGTNVVAIFDVQAGLLLRSHDISAPLGSPLSLAPDGHVVGTFSALLGDDDSLLQLVEFDASGGQLTTIVLDDVVQTVNGATAFGSDGNQYFTTPLEDRVTVRSPAGVNLAFIGVDAGLAAPNDLCFGPDGNLYVASSDSDRIVVIDTTGNFVRELGADSTLDGPQRLAFSPRRFSAKLSGKFVDASGARIKLKADAEAALMPGSGTLMLAIDDDGGDAQDFASLFGATLVFSGHQGAGEDSKTRRLLAACMLDATLNAGFGVVDLAVKGKLGKEDGIFRASKASGTLLRATAGRLFTGKLSAGKVIN